MSMKNRWHITDPAVFKVLREFDISCQREHENWYILSQSIPFNGTYEVAQGTRLISSGTVLFIEGSDAHREHLVEEVKQRGKEHTS